MGKIDGSNCARLITVHRYALPNPYIPPGQLNPSRYHNISLCFNISLWYSYCRTGIRICQPIYDRVHLLHKSEDLIKGTRLSLTRGRCQHAARTRSNIRECQDGMSLSKSGRQRWFIVLHPLWVVKIFPFLHKQFCIGQLLQHIGGTLYWGLDGYFFSPWDGIGRVLERKFRTSSEKIL